MQYDKKTYKAMLLYIVRWQTTSPIFIILSVVLTDLPYWLIITLGNLAGALIYFPIDRYIMLRSKK